MKDCVGTHVAASTEEAGASGVVAGMAIADVDGANEYSGDDEVKTGAGNSVGDVVGGGGA